MSPDTESWPWTLSSDALGNVSCTLLHPQPPGVKGAAVSYDFPGFLLPLFLLCGPSWAQLPTPKACLLLPGHGKSET